MCAPWTRPARYGVNLELLLKDISTVRYQPERITRWAEIAMSIVGAAELPFLRIMFINLFLTTLQGVSNTPWIRGQSRDTPGFAPVWRGLMSFSDAHVAGKTVLNYPVGVF